MKTARNALIFAVLVAVLIAWLVLIYFVPAEHIVEFIGVNNTYLVLFVFGVIAGFSSLSGGSFYVAVATFAAGGANPLLLALTGGAGLFLSDSAYYFVARHGVETFEEWMRGASEWLAAHFQKAPDWLMYTFVYCYGAFFPVPSDILLTALALARYPFRKFGPFLMAGDFTFVLILALLGHFGIAFVRG